MFDGTHTYEYADMRKGFHPDWNSYIFNYKRGEVKSFLISSATCWFDKFHADGIRVDAVSSMLKLNYSRKEGEWEPNEFGGDGNLEAIAFIKELNETIYRDFMFTHPGGKVLFMGNEFASTSEWNYKSELPWHLLPYDAHSKMKDCVRDLSKLYISEPALYEKQFSTGGFEWIDLSHRNEAVICFRRKGFRPDEELVIILNITPVVRHDWKVRLTGKESWKELQ